MGRSLRLVCPCKINLCLHILGRRSDGYHELRSLFLPLPQPADQLTVTVTGTSGEVAFGCNRPELERPDNLVVRACRAFQEATRYAPGLALDLDKAIPAGAGLGGGSSDAAATLRALNQLAGEQGLDAPALHALAARLGADVPFFLQDGPAWAEGIGEQLTPATVELAGWSLVVAMPPDHVATPWAYAAYDRLHQLKPGQTAPAVALTAPDEGVRSPFCPGTGILANSLEAAVFPAFPRVRRVKEDLLRSGAAAALMSGSGASVFGLFRQPSEARTACQRLALADIPTHEIRL